MADASPRFITPDGFARVRAEYDELFGVERPKIVDPASQSTDQVRFGAIVEVADEHGGRRTITIVGDDETEASDGRIGWSAPLARALIGARVGDERIVPLPSGEKSYEVMAIRYPPRA